MQTPRFKNVSCSQCGVDFGPGEHGFSHCDNHQGMSMQTNDSGHVAGGKTEADTSAHTATPWREEDGKIYGIENGEEVLICDVAPDNNALTEFDVVNAAFIVRACNAWDDVEALRNRLAELESK